MTATLCSLLTATLIGGVYVEVRELEGATHEGMLTSLSSEQLVLETSDGPLTWSPRELHAVTIADASPEPNQEEAATAIVELIDGSRLQLQQLAVEAGRATMQLLGGDEVRTSTRTIHAVHFQRHTAALQQQWDEIAASDRSGDLLVIRKTLRTTDENGVEQVTLALDSLEGVLYDVTADRVSFDFDGTRVEVPREKVEGLIYFHGGASNTPEPLCRVVLEDGTEWHLKSAELEDDALVGVSTAGIRARISLEQLVKIDFSIGNLVYLSDLAWDPPQWRPLIQSDATPPSLEVLFRPRRDEAFFGGPLILDGQVCEKGLAIHSRTVLSYRLTRDFQRFAAAAGIDPRFQAYGNVALTISGDGRELFSQQISSGQPPVAIDLDLSGIRRLTLLVDFGQDHVDIGDYLNLCNARLLK